MDAASLIPGAGFSRPSLNLSSRATVNRPQHRGGGAGGREGGCVRRGHSSGRWGARLCRISAFPWRRQRLSDGSGGRWRRAVIKSTVAGGDRRLTIREGAGAAGTAGGG